MNKEKTAVVTGASSGLGKVFAEQLAQKGYNLFLIARRTELLEKISRELIGKYQISVEIMTADLANAADLQRVENRLEQISSLEYLVNSAGFGGNRKFPDVNIEIETNMILVHCLASMRLCRAALVPMKANRFGRIINLASVAGFLNGDGSADYSATKAYLIAFSKSLYCDVGSFGIRVQALCPGFTRTGFHDTESMKSSTIKQDVPNFLWLNAQRVVRASLQAINRPRPFFRVICIPTILYKTVTFFGSEWYFAPLRILLSGGKIR